MNGTISQLASIVAFGNAFLHEGYDVRDFHPHNKAVTYCNKVAFVELHRSLLKTKEVQVADTPQEWFHRLNEQGCRGLALKYQPTQNPQVADHLVSGFVGGGGNWFAVVVLPQHIEYWQARWEVTDKDAPDSNIWSVIYGKVASEASTFTLSNEKLFASQHELERVLTEITAFAAKHNIDPFDKAFASALRQLRGETPVSEHIAEVAPLGYFSPEAERLFAAAYSSWVFGGMGSWNDVYFDGDESEVERYSSLSASLYTLINICIEQSINSYLADRRR